jgi:hypothetical protein
MFAPDSQKSESKERKPKNPDKMIEDLAGVFTDPLIVFPGGWEDTLPDWIKTEITLERLVMNMQELHGEEPTATDAEACAYLYTASLTAPMDGDWTEIYLYLATKLMERNGTQVPDDIRKDTLNDYQVGELKKLKGWIYRQRTKARQEKRKQERALAKAEAETRAPKQLSLIEE